MKKGQKSIRLNPIQSETSIQMNPSQVVNPNKSELGLFQTEFSIRINPNESEAGMIQINSNRKFGLDQSKLGLIRIEK